MSEIVPGAWKRAGEASFSRFPCYAYLYCKKQSIVAATIAKTFASANEQRKGNFGKFSLFETRNNVCSRLDWDIAFFNFTPSPPPPMEGYPMKFFLSAALKIASEGSKIRVGLTDN